MMMKNNTDQIFDEMTFPGHTGVIACMGPEGDFKQFWNKLRLDQVEAARTFFNAFVKDKKYTAYEMDERGNGKLAREFNPEAKNVVLRPQMRGG